MFILGLVVGILLTIVSVLFFRLIKNNRKDSKPKKKRKYIRRGLYTGEFTRTYGNSSNKDDYTASAEIIEVERTKTKSKVEVVNLKTSMTSDERNRNQIIDIIEGWIDSNDSHIEWFEKHPGDERASKIDDILSENEN